MNKRVQHLAFSISIIFIYLCTIILYQKTDPTIQYHHHQEIYNDTNQADTTNDEDQPITHHHKYTIHTPSASNSIIPKAILNLFIIYIVICIYTQINAYISILENHYIPPKETIKISSYTAVQYQEYEEWSLDKTSKIVRIRIDDKVDYGSHGNSSLAKIEHDIRQLANDTTHNTLWLYIDLQKDLITKNSYAMPRLSVAYTIIKALEYYKQNKENTTIIAYAATYTPASYMIACSAHKIYTNSNNRIYLPTSMLYPTLDKYLGTGLFSETFKEKPITTIEIKKETYIDKQGQKKKIWIAGKYKLHRPWADTVAIHKHTYLKVWHSAINQNKNIQKNRPTIPWRYLPQLLYNPPIFYKAFSVQSISFKSAQAYYLIDGDQDAMKIFLRNRGKIPNDLTSISSGKKLEDTDLRSINTIRVVYIQGEIDTGKDDNLQTEQLLILLAKFKIDTNIKGILLVINTHGGNDDKSEDIAHAINNIKKLRIPVVAYIQDNCLSAGYKIASTANMIIANQTAILGSIGITAPEEDNEHSENKKTKLKNHYLRIVDSINQARKKEQDESDKQRAERYNSIIATQGRSFPMEENRLGKFRFLRDEAGDYQTALGKLKEIARIANDITIVHHELD